MRLQSKRRDVPGVTAGSMADIAFLLLIFFLVTTTIEEDRGVLVKLPPWEEDPEDIKMNDVFTVALNARGQLLIEDDLADVNALPERLTDYVLSPTRKPTQAVVSLVHDRSTGYPEYLAVYDALIAGYHAMWEAEAERRYGRAYEDLDVAEKKAIRSDIPMVISEAEPSDYLSSTLVE